MGAAPHGSATADTAADDRAEWTRKRGIRGKERERESERGFAGPAVSQWAVGVWG